MNANSLSFLVSKWTSLLYAALLIAIPWEAIRGDQFADVQNYISRIEIIQEYGSDYFTWDWSFVGLLKFEFLWFQIISLAANNSLEAIVFLKVITAVSAFISHDHLKKYLGGWWSLAILINPITVDLLSSQVRSALAFSLFLLLIGNKHSENPGKIKTALLLALPFIHTAMVYVLAVYFVSLLLSRADQFSKQIKVLTAVVIAVGGAVAASVVVPGLAEAVGDRRDFSQFAVKSISYLAFWLLWGFVLIVSISNAACLKWEYYFSMIVCLSGALMDILGMPGFRFIALSIPVIFSTIPLVNREKRTILSIVTPAYGALLFAYWVL